MIQIFYADVAMWDASMMEAFSSEDVWEGHLAEWATIVQMNGLAVAAWLGIDYVLEMAQCLLQGRSV